MSFLSRLANATQPEPVAPAEDNRGRFDQRQPIGVVDIGSNSVRLVIYEGAVRAPTSLFNEKELCGLGRGFTKDGRLAEKAVISALRALRRFRAVADLHNVTTLRAVATAAVRDAANGDAFIARACEILRCEVETLSGEREAQLAANGVQMGFVDPDGIAGDLGGGSLELVRVKRAKVKNAVTLPLGGLKLLENSLGRMAHAVSEAETHIGNVEWLPKTNAKTFYAVGGTWRSLAKLHMAQNKYPISVLHGYTIPTDEAIAFCESVRRAKRFDQIPNGNVVSPKRREILPYGAASLEQVLKVARPEKLVFSVFGIREGLIYDMLSPEQRDEDPLIAFCRDYARLRSRSSPHADELIPWTDPLFAAGKFSETDEERRLRHAACLLSDIGWRAHPDYRGMQTMGVVAHAALTGIDHPGRLFLALTVYARHAGPDEANGEALDPGLRALVSKRMMQRARILSAALRAAEVLACSRHDVIPHTPIRVDGDALILTLPERFATLYGDKLTRRFEALAGLLGLKFVIDGPTPPDETLDVL